MLFMIIEISKQETQEIEILELQFDLENIDLINCKFNREEIRLYFESSYIQGRLLEESWTVVERIEENGEYRFITVCKVLNIFLFDQPIRYLINT
ncbi:hypothetical protein H311_03859 [Anncaliia algerae PRA109]|nr:hypothetical protein H311_03859 [Anncaliia algerae PRA109]